MADRIALSKKIRFEVFKRDRFSCQYCGRHPPDVVLEIDHLVPVCDGGDAGEGNLLTACFDCNRGKAGTSLTVVPKDLAQRAAEVAEREEQLAGYREVFRRQKERIEDDMWAVAEELFGEEHCREGIRRDWLRSIKIFNTRLHLDAVLEAAEIASTRLPYSQNKQRFLYFCGICWNRIKKVEGLRHAADDEEGGA